MWVGVCVVLYYCCSQVRLLFRDMPRRDPMRGDAEQRFYFYLSFGQTYVHKDHAHTHAH